MNHTYDNGTELLAIIATLKQFCSMLLGALIVIHTDHTNLTFDNLWAQSMLRWRSYIEECSPRMNYLEGPNTVLGLPRCYGLPSEDELANATYLVPLSDTDSIDKIEECFIGEIRTVKIQTIWSIFGPFGSYLGCLVANTLIPP